jgi:hypothetical protein
MCDGGGGDGGGDGDVGEGGYGGTTGAGGGYGGGGGGSGGNVGGGAGPTSASPVVAPTGKGDLPEAGGGGAPGPAPSGGGGWEQATTLTGKNKSDPALGNMLSDSGGAFGFTGSQGAQGGFLAGSMLGGLPAGMIGALMGGMMGVSQGGGNVGDYGGPGPDSGGPLTANEYEEQRLADETGPSRGGDEGFISTMLGGGGSGGSAGGGDEGDDTGQSERGFGLSLSSDPSDGFRKYKRNVGDSELLKTLIFNEDEFTENLF